MHPPVFPHVLGVSAAFFFADAVVIFSEVEAGDVPGGAVEAGRPFEDWFGIGGEVEVGFGDDEGDKEGLFVNDHCAAAAEPFDDGDVFLSHFRKVEEELWLARYAHHDRPGRSPVDDAKTPVVGTEERFFKPELLEDGNVFEEDKMEVRANRRSP